MTAAVKTNFTPEDLLNLPDSVNYELIHGQLVQRHMGSESSAIALAIGSLLRDLVLSRRLGHVFTTDCGFQCFSDPDKVRKPDVSFIRAGRLPGERLPEGHVRIAPDLAVEVLSPGDLAYAIEQKVAEYLAAKVGLVWVVNPKTRSVRIHRSRENPKGPISALSESDKITGEDVLPGFECSVADFFQV